MAEQLVSVWVGTFRSQKALDEYLQEHAWEREAAVKPLNQLCSDFGMSWYDHDYLDTAELVAQEPVDADAAFGAAKGLQSARDNLLRACRRYKISKFNALCVISADAGATFAPPRKFLGKKIKNVPLVFLGTFEVERD